MTAYRVAEAKNTLPRLIDRALQGEEVVITRHGKPVVELKPPRQPVAPPRLILGCSPGAVRARVSA